jgi:hypothetical protein
VSIVIDSSPVGHEQLLPVVSSTTPDVSLVVPVSSALEVEVSSLVVSLDPDSVDAESLDVEPEELDSPELDSPELDSPELDSLLDDSELPLVVPPACAAGTTPSKANDRSRAMTRMRGRCRFYLEPALTSSGRVIALR